MKTTMALKPLVFALAAVMAMAAQAGGNDHGNNGGHGHNPPPPKGPTLEELLQIGAGAGAAVLDVQNNADNTVLNQGTQNNAGISGSLNGANGNVGANNVAGDGNQQDNAAALATADESNGCILLTSCWTVWYENGSTRECTCCIRFNKKLCRSS